MNEPICLVHRLGLMDYEIAWRLQDQLAAEIAAGERPPTLLLLEHPHTYTFGRRGHIENLLWDETELAQRGIPVHWVDRGGDVTYHGPGQLVGYPLLPLAPGGMRPDPTSGSPRMPQVDYVGYVRRLEQTLILALARLGVSAFQVDGMTGVWVERGELGNRNEELGIRNGESGIRKEELGDRKGELGEGRGESGNASEEIGRALDESGELKADVQPATGEAAAAKIAAIGVKVDARGISRHGFALNVNPDMSYWQGIIGCGLVGYPVTSLAEILQPAAKMDTVTEIVVSSFAHTYKYRIVEEQLKT